MYKNVRSMAKVLIYVQHIFDLGHRCFFKFRVGACVVRVAVFLTVVCILVPPNVARNAFCESTIIP